MSSIGAPRFNTISFSSLVPNAKARIKVVYQSIDSTETKAVKTYVFESAVRE